ncbi:MoaD/ThiS family protein [Halorarum halophilum]|uniref:MoaD/ThiS family protein n=1 Tax=Halorarum halophilum TaxID=2743090 RepID=A0A7D5KF25_9EURY|nr:MoaD/ThiS family protein [Halobaculum halophilum]QLG27296.1 MoaD/ThiS family protein [Halobaculum halophilum]
MQVEVNCYGAVGEAVGGKSHEMTLEDGATVRTVVERLDERAPGLLDRLLHDDPKPLVVMRNVRHVSIQDGGGTRLEDGDTLALSDPPMPEG